MFQAQQASSLSDYHFVGSYSPDGDAGMPSASTFGPIPALTGSHPVMAYALCDGGGVLDELRIVEAIVRGPGMSRGGRSPLGAAVPKAPARSRT